MLEITTLLALLVLKVHASTVPCVMTVNTHKDNGQTVWEVIYSDEGYGTENNCEYELYPNVTNGQILYVELRELYLVSKSGTCSALFEINGEHFCHVPYQHRCIIFRLTKDDASCQRFENPFQCEARIWKKFPLTVSIKSKSSTHDQRHVHFIYQYMNCSRSTTMLAGRSRPTGVQWSTWPENVESTTVAVLASTFDPMTVIVPLLILLIVFLTVSLSVIILRKYRTEKSNNDSSSYEIRKPSGNSLTAREYGTIENEYENVEKLKGSQNDEKEVIYNAIYERST